MVIYILTIIFLSNIYTTLIKIQHVILRTSALYNLNEIITLKTYTNTKIKQSSDGQTVHVYNTEKKL